jgi:hypothetical protein
MTVAGSGRAPRRNSCSQHADLVDPAQFSDFLPQPTVLLGHLRGGPVITLTSIGLGLPDPVPERLVMHVQLRRQLADHGLRVRLAIQAHSTRS